MLVTIRGKDGRHDTGFFGNANGKIVRLTLDRESR